MSEATPQAEGTCKLEIWVEGKTDARQSSTESRADYGGALLPIVRGTLLELSGLKPTSFDRAMPPSATRVRYLQDVLHGVRSGRRRRDRMLRQSAKLLAAIAINHLSRPEADNTILVVIWDQDADRDRRRARDEVNQNLRKRGYDGVVAGLCVEEVEAWLLADPEAFNTVFEQTPKIPAQSPESLNDPKTTFLACVSDFGWKEQFTKRSDLYGALGAATDLGTLAERCPNGYKALRDELNERGFPPTFGRKRRRH